MIGLTDKAGFSVGLTKCLISEAYQKLFLVRPTKNVGEAY